MKNSYKQPSTPYFVIHKDILNTQLTALKESLSEHWGNYIIGYSYKTNSLPWILKFFNDTACYAEVVSEEEYNLGKLIGVQENHFIYNGPIKSKETFCEALSSGCYVNIDSEREVSWLEELPPSDHYLIGIRVNFNIEESCPGQTPNPIDGSRFGFCYENGELLRIINQIRDMGFEISGLHLHISSKTRSLAIYDSISKKACEITEKYGLTLKYVDIGGGFFGGLIDKPQFMDYFKMICQNLKSKFSPDDTVLIVEPGMSLIGPSVSYVTSVIDVKKSLNAQFVITDGSRTNIDPLMTKSDYFHRFELSECTRKTIDRQIISGYTCVETDQLFSINNAEELCVGDKIIYDKVGAYTMTLSPLFIKYFPDVFLETNGKLILVRKKWSPNEYIQGSLL